MDKDLFTTLLFKGLLQEEGLRAEQIILTGLNQFAFILTSKKGEDLLAIKLHLLETIQDHADDKDIIALCLQMINQVEEHMKRVDS